MISLKTKLDSTLSIPDLSHLTQCGNEEPFRVENPKRSSYLLCDLVILEITLHRVPIRTSNLE